MTLKAKQLVKRAIVSLGEAAEVGNVDNVVFDREARMAALVFKRRASKRDVAATGIGNVCALGRDAVTIVDSGLIEGEEKIEELRTWPNLRQLIGCRVITEGGTYLGIVRDVLLDAEARRITDFELKGRGVWGRLRGDTIPAVGHLRFGTELLIVPNAVSLKGRATLKEIKTAELPPAVAESVVLAETNVRPVAADEPAAAPPRIEIDNEVVVESLRRAA